jgi:Mrp family chromosome partitioning ATPase
MSTSTIKTLGPPPSPARQAFGDSVNPSGIDELKSALRRSAVLILGVVILGIVAMNVIRQLGGPQYQSKARVILTGTNLSAAVLGINPVYQDPGRQDQAEQNLVNSSQLYAYAAEREGGRAGTASQLRRKTSATVSNNVVDFTATTSSPESSISAVNAVVTAYPEWRAKVSADAINADIAQIQAEMTKVGRTPELVKQLQQLQALKNLSSSDTLFVERAASATKTTPRPVHDSLLGALVGLVVALLLVGARELFDTTVRSEADVEDVLGVPVLATIETIPRRLRTLVLDEGGRLTNEYDLLAAKIAHVFDGHSGPVLLAVTSAISGEGKTTTATNLAAAVARRGANVLLADFDLRRPSVAEHFGIPDGVAGVAEVLSGSVQLRSVMWRVSMNGAGSGARGSRAVQLASRAPNAVLESAEVAGSLTVMPGGAPPKEQRAPSFARLPWLVERLPSEADFIVIDTPPALLIAGMAELAQGVDGVIVVARHGVVHRRRLRALGRQARSWRARLLGAVLNDGPVAEGNMYGRSYYGRS